MKINKLIICGLLLGISFYSCTEDDGPSIDDYPLNYEIPEISVANDIPVGAYLFNPTNDLSNDITWGRITEEYNQEAGKIGPNVEPVLGRYTLGASEDGARNLQQLIDWCKEARINFLVTTGVRENANTLYPNNINSGDSTFVRLMSGLHETYPLDMGDMKYAILMDMNNFCSGLTNNNLLEDAPTHKLTITNPDTGEKRDTLLTRENRLYSWFKRASHYFEDPTYLHLNGRPVLILSNPDKLFSSDSKKVYDNIRDTIKAKTGKDVFIIARQPAWTPPARYHYHFLSGGVDAVTMDNMCNVGGSGYDRTYWLNQFINENFKYNREYISQKYNIDFMPSVSASYSMYVNNGSYNYPNVFKNPDEFRKRCNVAKMNLGRNPMVFVESLNNWKYNTQIEPSIVKSGTKGYGSIYMDIVKDQFKKK